MTNLVKRPPHNELSEIKTLASLQRKYLSSYTRSQVDAMKTTMNTSIAAHELPLDRYVHEQDPVVWKRFCDHLCKRRPFLLNFEDAWPVQVSFDIKVKRNVKIACLDLASSHSTGQQDQKVQLASKEQCRDPTPLPPNQQALRRQTARISVERFSPYPMAAAPLRGEKNVLDPIDLTRRSQEPGSSSAFPIEVESEYPPPLSPELLAFPQDTQVPFTSSQATLVEVLNAPGASLRVGHMGPSSSDEVFVGCCECGHPIPSHLSGPNTRLTALLGIESKDTIDCLRALQEGGLMSDVHLNVFLRWPVPCRKAFIDDVDASKHVKQRLNVLVRAVAPPEAKRSADVGPSQSSTLTSGQQHCTKIPQPVDAEGEDTLTDPQKPLELLLKAMDLPDNQGPFRNIVAAVKDGARPYMRTDRPSRELFDAAVKDVCRKHFPLFERYENLWPARVILKRLAREFEVVALDDHLDPLASTFRSSSISPWTFGSQRSQATLANTQGKRSNGSPGTSTKINSTSHSPPTLPKISYTCPIHPGPDQAFVAPRVQRCLHSLGLIELIPVFALMGMPTEEDFQEFCGLSVGKKDNVVSAADLKVNVFQQLALKLDLWDGLLEVSPS